METVMLSIIISTAITMEGIVVEELVWITVLSSNVTINVDEKILTIASILILDATTALMELASK
mgnify:CR=1 FL=1